PHPSATSLTTPGLLPAASDRLDPSSSLPASAAFLSPSPRWSLRDLALLFDLAFLVHRPAVPRPPPAGHPGAVPGGLRDRHHRVRQHGVAAAVLPGPRLIHPAGRNYDHPLCSVRGVRSST